MLTPAQFAGLQLCGDAALLGGSEGVQQTRGLSLALAVAEAAPALQGSTLLRAALQARVLFFAEEALRSVLAQHLLA